jgi:ribosomal protein S18 acetylase RimI-like enzyme
MVIKRAADFDEGIREKISKIFVETFEKGLAAISKNKDALIKAFAHIFVLDNIYMAIVDDEVIGIIGYMGKEQYSIRSKSGILINHLGIIKGLFAQMILKQYSNSYPKLPDENCQDVSSIEFFAMDVKYMKMGILLEMMKNFLSLFENTVCMVEVTDARKEIIQLYEQLGFKKMYRKKYRFLKAIGTNNAVYMICGGGGSRLMYSVIMRAKKRRNAA